MREPLMYDQTKGEDIYSALDRAGAFSNGGMPVIVGDRQVAGSPQLVSQPTWFDRMGAKVMGSFNRPQQMDMRPIAPQLPPSPLSVIGAGMAGRGVPPQYYPKRELPRYIQRAPGMIMDGMSRARGAVSPLMQHLSQPTTERRVDMPGLKQLIDQVVNMYRR